jgi:hypothetical protein
MKPHENSNILDLWIQRTLILTVDLEVCGGFCDANFNSNLLCTTQLISAWKKIIGISKE